MKKRPHHSFDFREHVFAVVARIPRGETLTYKEVAERVGRPRAYRAVGTILSTNTSSRIPCHRVIRSDGGMGGYGLGGVEVKRQKLKREGAL